MIIFRPKAQFDKSATIVLMTPEMCNGKFLKRIRVKADILNIIQDSLRHKKFKAKKGGIFPLLQGGRIILLVGLGPKKEQTSISLRTAVRSAVLSNYLNSSNVVEIVVDAQEDHLVRAIIDGILIGGYSWRKYRKINGDDILKRTYVIAAKAKTEFKQQIAISHGLNYARDLVNDNADITTSVYIEKEIRSIIKGQKNIRLEVLNRKELKAKGLNLHLAVNQGSTKEPKLIIANYLGERNSKKSVAIVGKGITFDTGGLNLKPSGHLENMRCDMSGAAAVIGTLKNVVSLRIKRNIIFVLGLAENVIGPDAYKPGDVVKSFSGKTIEIGNTDAEGRLVLADAISYVCKKYKPSRLIDIATLTGACIVALGYDYSGLVSNDKKAAEKLLKIGELVDDRVWQLPNYPELAEAIKSEFADIKNIGWRGAAGTMTAAEFLRQFVTDNISWIHLDIAGTAFTDSKSRTYFSYGATGAGVRLLTSFLLNRN